MIEDIDVDADLREGDHGTDLLDGEIKFSQEVTLPSEEQDARVDCTSLQVLEAGIGQSVATTIHDGDKILVTTMQTTNELIEWVRENAEPTN